MEKIKGLGIKWLGVKWLKRCEVDPIFDHACQQVLWTVLAMLRPAPLMHCLLTLRLLAFDVIVMSPVRNYRGFLQPVALGSRGYTAHLQPTMTAPA